MTNPTKSPSRDHSLEKSRQSNHHQRHKSNSRRHLSKSRTFYRSRSRSHVRSKYPRGRSPCLRSTRYRDSREELNRFNPPRNDIIAVFGLDRDTTETDLFNFYKKYGCNRCKVIYDRRTGKPRGFGFVYFDSIDDASRAKRATNGKRLLTRELRVDYSIGERANSGGNQGSCDRLYGYQANSDTTSYYGY